jgi:hypothetical protein
MTNRQANAGLLWTAIITLTITVGLAIAQVSSSTGKMEARMQTLEKESSSQITRQEWEESNQDVRDRLTRIENMLDSQSERR